ncbi:DNA primase, large subunit [Epithele typhae]|uniref:DNA primase, large subunit n=1 Tax=Epithele typhae TaxID=378194 RepID=UPI002007C08A|nr:DNA primase, large subunit [Epithele typhae]KAH9946019.1 DNA primase, large subunit [Epithele typhae]
MQSRKEKGDIKPAAVGIHSLRTDLKYPLRMNFYDKPPTEDITIEEFETAALDRLRVLAEIESCFARNRTWEDTRKIMDEIFIKHLPLDHSTAKTKPIDEQRRKDHIGHFVLRFAFCRTEDLRRRFIKAEVMLFRLRYADEPATEQQAFMNSKDFDWQLATPEEMQGILQPMPSESQGRYYKLKWTRVPNLVERREVIMKGGMAYVHSAKQAEILYREFQTHLEKELEATAKALPRLDEDTRLVPILDNLSKGFQAGVASQWSDVEGSPDDTLTAEMIDEMAYKHFPACMRNLHMCLRRDGHLKHFGRLQYGLFLKVCGLSIEEALVFWRKAFRRPDITDDKFNKEYKYNFRHSYGLEGKRANYAAKSCQQIIMAGARSAGDSHGCPYIDFSMENLQSALLTMYGEYGLSSTDMPELMELVKKKHYHVACTRVFEITHSRQGVKKGEGVGAGESVTHPNQYAARSRELSQELKKKAEGETDVVMQ